MKIICNDFMGLNSIEIPLTEAPVLVMGPNYAGKSSLATAIAGLLTGRPDPLEIGGRVVCPYIRDGQDYGEVLLRSDSGVELLRWVLSERLIRRFPEAPKNASVHALSLVDFVHMPAEARTELWESAFLPDASALFERTVAAASEIVVSEDRVLELSDALRLRKWKEVVVIYEEKAAAATAKWREITGEKWGRVRSGKWCPSGWKKSLENVSVGEAQKHYEDADSALKSVQVEEGITAAAKEEADAARLNLEVVLKRPELQSDFMAEVNKNLGLLREHWKEVVAELVKVRADLDAQNRAEPLKEDAIPCPECGVPLVIHGKALTKAASPSGVAAFRAAWKIGKDRLAEELRTLEGQKSHLVVDIGSAEVEHQKKTGDRNELLAAAQSYELTITHCKGETVVDDAQVERIALARAQQEQASKVRGLLMAKAAAEEAHAVALDYHNIYQLLGKRGIRSELVREGVASVSKNLFEWSRKFGWPFVEIDANYNVLVNSRVAALCAASEQWIAQFLLQAAFCKLTGGDRVLADGADILFGHDRGLLVEMCKQLADDSIYTILFASGPPFHPSVPESWQKISLEGHSPLDSRRSS